MTTNQQTETVGDLLDNAIALAQVHHQYQLYDGQPYINHLRDVYLILNEHGCTDNEILAAAWLHDVLEDCPVHYNDVKEICGERVAEIVYAVTDELGRNRAERHLKTYPKIRAMEEALIVKLADRIANVRMGGSMLKMYRDEHKEFMWQFGEVHNTEIVKALRATLHQLINQEELQKAKP